MSFTNIYSPTVLSKLDKFELSVNLACNQNLK